MKLGILGITAILFYGSQSAIMLPNIDDPVVQTELSA